MYYIYIQTHLNLFIVFATVLSVYIGWYIMSQYIVRGEPILNGDSECELTSFEQRGESHFSRRCAMLVWSAQACLTEVVGQTSHLKTIHRCFIINTGSLITDKIIIYFLWPWKGITILFSSPTSLMAPT